MTNLTTGTNQTTGSTSTAAPGARADLRPAVVAALVCPKDGGPESYPLFEVLARRAGEVFLAAPFLLELDEQADVEFRLGDGPVRARVRVIEVERGDHPGMVVALLDADEATSARIISAAGP